jgi:hypothetical protein
MCSIEEAWAGQTFDGYRVQSQADLHRKYMPITDDLLTRNNEFTVTKKEPVSRMGNQGINTKMVRPLQAASAPSSAMLGNGGNNALNVSFTDNHPLMDNYGGLEPRPGYMSIYDNASNTGNGIPLPIQTQQASRNSFGDINQAFQVSPAVERFMARGNNSNNPLMNEDSNDDQLIVYKKFNPSDSSNQNSKDDAIHGMQTQITQVQISLKDILARLENVEQELQHTASRNMYDMILYVLVGMLIAFILYSLLRK